MPSSPSPAPTSNHSTPEGDFPPASLLTDLDPESRQAIQALMVESDVPSGQPLLEQGQPNDRLFVLVEGTVTILRTHPTGQTEAVTHLNAPAVFGTTSFFRPVPPMTTTRTATPCKLLTLDRDAHERLRKESPGAAEALALAAVRILSERFDILLDRFDDYIQKHPEGPARASEWGRFRARLFEEPGV